MKIQTREQALEKVKSTIDKLGFDNAGQNLESSEITEETNLKDFMDSLDVVEFTMELEKETDKSITDSSVESWETVKDVIDTLLIVA